MCGEPNCSEINHERNLVTVMFNDDRRMLFETGLPDMLRVRLGDTQQELAVAIQSSDIPPLYRSEVIPKKEFLEYWQRAITFVDAKHSHFMETGLVNWGSVDQADDYFFESNIVTRGETLREYLKR